MNVTAYKSGTDAIMYQLEVFDINTVIIPQNLCPEVALRISNSYKIVFAPVLDHFEPANYRSVLPLHFDKVAILFVHPYGIYRELERNQISNFCDFIIDDCCLCDPLAILQSHVKNERSYVFSFGYSKVLDFGNGGLLVAPKSGGVSCMKLRLPFKMYGVSVPEGTDYDGTMSLSTFVKIPFFLWLQRISDSRNKHKNEISKIYKSFIPAKVRVLDSPWRMVLKVSFDCRSEVIEILSNIDLDMFVGSNYPLLSNDNRGVRFLSHVDKSGEVPLNFFHDFRFDKARAVLLGEIVKGVIK
jgi:hypothetical protein